VKYGGLKQTTQFFSF